MLCSATKSRYMKGNKNSTCKPEQNIPLLLSAQHAMKNALASKNFIALAPKITKIYNRAENTAILHTGIKQLPSYQQPGNL